MRWVRRTRGNAVGQHERHARRLRLAGVLFVVLLVSLFSLLLGGYNAPRAGHLVGAVSVARAAEGNTHASGCGHAAPLAPGTSGEERLQVGSTWRTFILHVPRGYSPTVPQPLVLVFHGHSSTADHFARLTRFSVLADAHDFVAIYPQGAIGMDAQTGWNTHRKRDPTTNDLGFVRALLGYGHGHLCVDSHRIYAAGFSNGGGFVADMACDLPKPFAALADVSGDLYPQPSGCHPAQPVPLLEIHGSADPINPYQGSELLGYSSVSSWLAKWVGRDGCVGTPERAQVGLVVTEKWTACSQGVEIVHIKLIGGKHLWPGAILPPGAPAADHQFDATSAIWAFFAAHRSSQPTTTKAS